MSVESLVKAGAGRRDPLEAWMSRQTGPDVALRPDMRVPYAVAVGEPEVNREAWAATVRKLTGERERGNQAAFSRAVGVDVKTVGRWLRCLVDVSEESVRQVARTYDLNPIKLLVEVGYYDHMDVGGPLDEGERQIMAMNVPENIRERMLARYRRRMEQAQTRAIADIEADLEDLGWMEEQQRTSTD